MNEEETFEYVSIEDLEQLTTWAYQRYLRYAEILARRKEPKDEISQAEVHRIASLIGTGGKK